MTPTRITVSDRMQRGYSYLLTEPVGRNYDAGFRPELTPSQLLALGIFGGKYMTDCRAEFPASWYARAKLSPDERDPTLNFFGVNAPAFGFVRWNTIASSSDVHHVWYASSSYYRRW